MYLEVQVHNQSSQSIVFDHVKLLPQPKTETGLLDYVDMNLDPSTGRLPSSLAHLSIGDVSQFLFSITQEELPPPNQPVQVLGRLDISWRGTMGEPGRLQTSALTRKLVPKTTPVPAWAPDKAGLSALPGLQPELLVEVLDHTNITVGTPFNVVFLIRLPVGTNEKPLQLTLQHLPSNQSMDDGDSSRMMDEAPTSDWSLTNSLVSLSSSLLPSSKRTNSMETNSPTTPSSSESPRPNRWTMTGAHSRSKLSTPAPMSRHRSRAREFQDPVILLGSQSITLDGLSLDKTECRICLDYLACEPGLWALGGLRLISSSPDSVEGSGAVLGEWPQTGYVWCRA